MLTPEQIAALQDAAGRLTDPVSDFLIEDIARRVSEAGQLTGTAAYQAWRAQQLGVSRRTLKKELQKRLNVSGKELRQLMTQAAEVGYRFDLKRLPHGNAVPFARNGALQQIVSAAVELAQDDFSNLVQTLGFIAPDGKSYPLTEAYQKTCDFAFQQVAMGAADYHTAVRRAVRQLTDHGIQTIDYETGASASLEAAVRRNVMGGLGLLQEQIGQRNFEVLGADGWEITAHANSAPDHEPVQGRQFKDEEFRKLNNSLKRRIGTLNCGHMAFPVVVSANTAQYTDEELAAFREENERGVTYEGRHYTGYEATQVQRKLEQSIRRQKRRVTASEATGDAQQLAIDKARLTRLNQEYARFSKAAGLRTERERTWVLKDMGHREATAAERARDAELLQLRTLERARKDRLIENPSLALPEVERAVLESEKFTKYLFNPENPTGYAKGIAFTSRLGYDIDSWKELMEEIRKSAALYPVLPKGDTGYGLKYEQQMILYGKKGVPANVVVSWIIEDGRPRMTSAYIKEVKKHDD